MSLKYSVYLSTGFVGELASFKDPIKAYETLTHVAQTADELGFETVTAAFRLFWTDDEESGQQYRAHLVEHPPISYRFKCEKVIEFWGLQRLLKNWAIWRTLQPAIAPPTCAPATTRHRPPVHRQRAHLELPWETAC